jgi:hypothetical protein
MGLVAILVFSRLLALSTPSLSSLFSDLRVATFQGVRKKFNPALNDGKYNGRFNGLGGFEDSLSNWQSREPRNPLKLMFRGPTRTKYSLQICPACVDLDGK